MAHKTVAENSKNLARKYVSEGNFGRAFSHYLVALKLSPDWREQLREEFSTVLCKWGTILEERKRYSDLFSCYEQAVEAFPDNVVILNNLGAHLLRCGLLKEAAHYFRQCINIDRHYIRAAHNLESVANLAVERWHFRMLNDEYRNEAFREAIIKKVSRGFHRVLDVGTGTGILSLFCAEGKASQIYACDSSPIMIEIAQRVLLSNNAPNVMLIAKHSTDIQVPADIPQRLSLLVTETFDAGLLGENILHTLTHAWQHLLLPPSPNRTTFTSDPSALVLPFGAVLYATGIEFDPVANDFHLERITANSSLLENCRLFRNCDNYDTRDLTRSPYRRLTGTEKVFEFDFNDPGALAEVSRGVRRQVVLRCDTSGRLDCIAVWFDLRLDEDIVLNTGPLSKVNAAWDQAIFPLRRSSPVEENQDIAVDVAIEGGKLSVNFTESTGEGPAFELSEGAMRVLRSEKLAGAVAQLEGELASRFSGSVNVLDCYPFPVFGLKLLMKRSGGRFADRLSCFVATEGDRRLVEFLAEKHGIEADVVVRRESDLAGCLGEREFDVMLLDLMEASGEIKDGVLLELDRLKSLLKPDGLVLPERVTVMAEFIHSDWLNRTSKVVDDSVTCGYNIAEFINVYQVRHFVDFDVKTIEKSSCTEPFELFDLLASPESTSEKIVPVRSGAAAAVANALVYWLKIRFTEGCDEILTIDDIHHQAAFLFHETKFIENIKFKVIRSNGLFNIEFLRS